MCRLYSPGASCETKNVSRKGCPREGGRRTAEIASLGHFRRYLRRSGFRASLSPCKAFMQMAVMLFVELRAARKTYRVHVGGHGASLRVSFGLLEKLGGWQGIEGLWSRQGTASRPESVGRHSPTQTTRVGRLGSATPVQKGPVPG